MTALRRRRGSQVVEAGLVLPLLFGMFMGLLDWSWLMFQASTLRHAAMEAARAAGGVVDEVDLDDVARTAAVAMLRRMNTSPDGLVVETSVTEEDAGRTVTVTLVFPFDPPTGLGVSPRTLEMSAAGPWYGWIYDEE